jgi:hypothetical protein
MIHAIFHDGKKTITWKGVDTFPNGGFLLVRSKVNLTESGILTRTSVGSSGFGSFRKPFTFDDLPRKCVAKIHHHKITPGIRRRSMNERNGRSRCEYALLPADVHKDLFACLNCSRLDDKARLRDDF